jgi:hypothetical protein
MEMERLRPSDWVGVLLIGLIGLIPLIATLVIAWWVLLGGEP